MTLPRLVLAALLVAAPGAALALTPQEEAVFRDACTSDYLRWCAMHAPDTPQVNQCFQSKMSQLSPECRNAINQYSRRNPSGRR